MSSSVWPSTSNQDYAYKVCGGHIYVVLESMVTGRDPYNGVCNSKTRLSIII